MGLFRRSPEQVRSRQDAAIADFWSWWSTVGHDQAAAVFDDDARTPQDLDAFATAVARKIDPLGLAFETGPGRVARHVLVVTAAGDPDLRELAQRWLTAAPAPDDAFEYAAFRQPVADPSGTSLRFGDTVVDIASMTVVPQVDGRQVHVSVSHPAFAGAPEEVRGQVTFLFLDALLGEEAVEAGIGAVTWTGDPQPDGIPILGLPALVESARRGLPEADNAL
ncbi:hypothetical protein [Cellulomonas sp.]|uniref:hypothetical protein n=1 Tax=Cellulomonas sp. TaxID=40001 RepID=UPI003BA97389